MPVVGNIGALPQPLDAVDSQRRSAPEPGFETKLRETQASANAMSERPGRVAMTRTRLSGSEAAGALSQAYQQLQGHAPTQDTLAILTAQWSHETGRGGSMYNFNFGGIKGTSPQGMSVAARTHEGWGNTRRQIVDNFRAYPTAEDGAVDYVSLLKRRYPDALQAAAQGDPAGFVRQLKAGGYFTGNEQAYVKSVTRLANTAMARGFDAVGAEGSDVGEIPQHFMTTPPAAALPSTREMLAMPAAVRSLFPSAQVAVHEVDVSVLADELSRAALSIVPVGVDDDGEDDWAGPRRS